MTTSHTTRRGMLESLFGLGAGTVLCHSLDFSGWRAYEAVESAWIQDRHNLLVDQFPAFGGAASLDLELKLAELQRRGMQFRYLSQVHPRALRGGVWQLAWLPWNEKDSAALAAQDVTYRRQDEHIRVLTGELRHHPEYNQLRLAQTRLWKTPEYKDLHRRYTSQIQNLQNLYGYGDDSAVTSDQV